MSSNTQRDRGPLTAPGLRGMTGQGALGSAAPGHGISDDMDYLAACGCLSARASIERLAEG